MQNRNLLRSDSLAQLRKPATPGEICVEIFAHSVGGVVFAILFGIYTSDPESHNGDQCVDLLSWGRYTYYCAMITTIVSFFVNGAIYFCIRDASMSTISSFGQLKKCVSSLSGIAWLIGFVGLWISYSKDEPCGGLRSLTFGYIIFAGCIIGLACLTVFCICCVSCFVVGSAVGMEGVANRMEMQKPLQV